MSAAQVAAIRAYRAPDPEPAQIDAEAIRAELLMLLTVRDAKARLAERVAQAKAREDACCRKLAELAGSGAGVVIDGRTVVIRSVPGHVPIVYVQTVTVIA